MWGRDMSEHNGASPFIAVGAGLPTQDNVHVVAQAMIPDARVVNADNDPMTVTHARALLARTQGVRAILSEPHPPDVGHKPLSWAVVA